MHPTPGNTETLIRLEQIIPQREVTDEMAAVNRAKGRWPVKPRPASPGLIPVSAATWWRWVKEGRAPQPIKLGKGVTCWKLSEVLAVGETLGLASGDGNVARLIRARLARTSSTGATA